MRGAGVCVCVCVCAIAAPSRLGVMRTVLPPVLAPEVEPDVLLPVLVPEVESTVLPLVLAPEVELNVGQADSMLAQASELNVGHHLCFARLFIVLPSLLLTNCP